MMPALLMSDSDKGYNTFKVRVCGKIERSLAATKYEET